MRVAIVFPGQGTQSPGMGRDWKGHPSWSVVEQAEAALDEDLAGLLLDAPAEQLSRTRDAQLAVLLTSLVTWDAARTRIDSEHQIVGFAGHSLGQVTALIASGVVSLDDGVRFAAQRAVATQRAADAHPGRMAALLGATLEQADRACGDGAWVANDNAPGQVVIAGTPEGVETAIENAKALGVRRAMSLNVGGAFHTPLMSDACATLSAALDSVTFGEPTAAVVSNDDARAYRDGASWHDRLVQHPVRTVRWRESMLTLAGELACEAMYEVGSGSMIAGVAKRTVPDVAVIALASPDDIATLEQLPTEETR